MKLRENVLLKNYTTFRIGGPARYFVEAASKEEIIEAITLAKEKNLPFFILGQGSNVLAKDRGFLGIVIRVQSSVFGVQNYNSKCKISCEAGVPLSKIVSESLNLGVEGLEWATGIPGTIGGAIYGNAGAFDFSMSDVIERVEVFDAKSFQIKILNKKNCLFGYRESIFKKKKNFIIISAVLILKKGEKSQILKKIIKHRGEKLKNQPLDHPSSGCVFKNHKKSIKNNGLLKEFPELKVFNKKGIVPAGWLIEKCGLKGKKFGGAKISEKHANFIVNLGNARFSDVKKLVALIKKSVKGKFKIELEEETQEIGL